MLLAKSIMLKRNSASHAAKMLFTAMGLLSVPVLFAQDNSPYSRYGLGDIVPNTNIANRALGGIQAGYADPLIINFNNPASYSSFYVFPTAGSKKIQNGRVVLDAGINLEGHTLRAPNQANKFTSSNALFSYLQVGVPLRKGWGLSFGLRPVTRISYLITDRERLIDPRNGAKLDSAVTEYSGDGGSYLPTIGTGIAIKNLSLGVNVGYMFGKRETSNKRALVNDTLAYNNSNYTTRSSFGGLFLSAGAQYKIKLAEKADATTALRLGVSGNIRQTLKGSQDFVVETFVRDPQNGDFPVDSVSVRTNNTGEVEYPASYTVGFVIDHQDTKKGGGWLAGLDFIQTAWDDYRFFGARDAVKSNWQIRAGAQLIPEPSRNYFSNVAYRAGFFTGADYITAGGKDLPQWGLSLGLGLPIANYNRMTSQFTRLNLAVEYSKRGNDQNLLKENTFRVSVGFNFSDVWFNKRRYD
jgi:hypothetical protein